MKLFAKNIYLTLCGLGLFSCASKQNSPVKTVRADQIQPNRIVHDTLSTEQIAQIKKIQVTFAEVNPSTLDETITNFKRDQNPDNEINEWLGMAAAYEKFLSAKPSMELSKKKEAYKLILLRSMMDAEQAKQQAGLQLLTTQEIDEILSYYDKAPSPLKVSH
jgi:hypothetical protein